jgi:cysteine-rich repeat protein
MLKSIPSRQGRRHFVSAAFVFLLAMIAIPTRALATGTCGDGIIDAGEECDDTNALGGDGRSRTLVETCSRAPESSVCATTRVRRRPPAPAPTPVAGGACSVHAGIAQAPTATAIAARPAGSDQAAPPTIKRSACTDGLLHRRRHLQRWDAQRARRQSLSAPTATPTAARP